MKAIGIVLIVIGVVGLIIAGVMVWGYWCFCWHVCHCRGVIDSTPLRVGLG